MADLVKNYVNVAVGILLDPQQQILLTQRQNHQSYSDYWEFPGGKLEIGEVALHALTRELYEEIGIETIDVKPLVCVAHHYPEYAVRLHVFIVDQFQGEPFGKEGQKVLWRGVDEIADLKLLPANSVILTAVKHYLQPET